MTTKHSKLFLLIPLVALIMPIAVGENAYADSYGHEGEKPLQTTPSWSHLTNVKGDIYTYQTSISSGTNTHIDRMVYLTDTNSFSMGAGYYEGTTNTGTEYYRYMYYVDDDGAMNDNQHYLYTTHIPSSPSWVTAEVVESGTSSFSFNVAGYNVGSYSCTGTCTSAVIAGAASWGSDSTSHMNVIADIKNLKLERNTDTSYVTWSSVDDGFAYHCENYPETVGLNFPTNINEMQVNFNTTDLCSVDGDYLYNEGAGG